MYVADSKRLTLAGARKMMDHATEKAQKAGHAIAVAIVDAGTLAVTYAGGLLNLCMALAVNPASGEVTVVGTEATNEIRYEPNLSGTFVRVEARSP